MPMPWSTTEISTFAVGRLGGDQHGGVLGRVGHRVGDQVGDRGGDLLLVAEDLEARRAGGDDRRCAWSSASMALVSTAKPMTSSRHTAVGVSSGSSAWSRDSSMICCTRRVEPVALGEHPLGEPLDRLRVVAGVGDRLGEQPDRADRRLQLVAHVGDEVAAYLLDPALAGAVLDQGQHQVRAERRDAGGDVARGPRRLRPITSSTSRIWPSRRTWRTTSLELLG